MSNKCPMCTTSIGGIGIIEGFRGKCPDCGAEQFPKNVLAVLVRNKNGTHVFAPIARITCPECGYVLQEIAMYCQNTGIDVTAEFESLKRGKNA